MHPVAMKDKANKIKRKITRNQSPTRLRVGAAEGNKKDRRSSSAWYRPNREIIIWFFTPVSVKKKSPQFTPRLPLMFLFTTHTLWGRLLRPRTPSRPSIFPRLLLPQQRPTVAIQLLAVAANSIRCHYNASLARRHPPPW